MPVYVGVVGSGDLDGSNDAAAEQIGREVAEAGGVLVCGGLGGVMEAACRGASVAGGLTIGLLPGSDRHSANRWVKVVIPTGLGELRNGLIVRACDVLIAVGGEYGTLSEVAFALKLGLPVVGVSTWNLTRPDGTLEQGVRLSSTEGAVGLALKLVGTRAS
jgi:uncharacterized protein (TIGR00725 family)